MYGGLQIAKDNQDLGFSSASNLQEAAIVLNQGIKANLPLDKGSQTYFGQASGYGFAGEAAQTDIANVWDIKYWQEWFD